MGRLLYGSPPTPYGFDDRVLTHLQTVITTRFRRGEGFLLTIDDEDGLRRAELWLHPTIPIQYEYDERGQVELNPLWLRELSNSSHGRIGLHVTPEPEPGPDPRGRGAAA